jgi:hypothetical protein
MHGSPGRFYESTLIYYEKGGLVYWTMGAPLDETIIVNRCRAADTYEHRLKAGTLPKSSSPSYEAAAKGPSEGLPHAQARWLSDLSGGP